MATVFVNYRSDDASGTAVLMKRELSRAFGENSIFLATEMIPPGNDFESELLRRVRGCEVLMVLVGPRWLTAPHPAGGRAIDHEHDWVRREITVSPTKSTGSGTLLTVAFSGLAGAAVDEREWSSWTPSCASLLRDPA